MSAIFWFAVQTRSQCERITQTRLIEASYEVFLPLERYFSRWFREIRDRPLFNCYVLVGVDIQARTERRDEVFSPIRRTEGVLRLLVNDRTPDTILATAIAPQAVDELRRAEAIGLFDKLPSKLKAGDDVRTIQGPFAGLIGKIKNASNRTRVEVLFSIMGREVPVSVPLSQIEQVC